MQIIDHLWPLFKAKNSLKAVVGLGALYKTLWTTKEGGQLILDPSEPLPIKFVRTSHLPEGSKLQNFLSAHNSRIQLDNSFNPTSGLIGGFLMRGEMEGVSVVNFKVIVDEHRVTSESLQQFGPIVNDLFGHGANMDEVFLMKQFKPVLKELNAKSHGIFN